MPNASLHHDNDVSTGVADSEQLAKTSTAIMTGGENPAGDKRTIGVVCQCYRLIYVSDPHIYI